MKQSISSNWTTGSGNKIEFTANVETFDFDWTVTYSLAINGVEAQVYMVQEHKGQPVLSIAINNKPAAIIITESLKNSIEDMIITAKNELKPRIAEYNEIEEARIKADRGY
jgi:PHD/YefM family antitoxin component YafN of YafNO toxin-antitoxin module